MKLGLYVSRTPTPVVVDAAKACERFGVDSIWHDESLWYRGTLSMLSACAVETTQLRLGCASINPYIMNPTYLAMQYATLAELSGGRAVVGVGSGVASWVEQLGMKWSYPRTSVKEAIEIAGSLLANQRTNYDGKVFSVQDVELGFKSTQPTPLYWGAMGDRSIETAGEVADGWVLSVMEPTAYVERGLELLAKGAGKRGRTVDDFDLVQYQLFACDEDSRKARSEAKDLIATIFRLEFEFLEGQDSTLEALSADLVDITAQDYAAIMRRLSDGVSPDEAIPDTLLDQTAIAGDPAECAAQLHRFGQLGITETALQPLVVDAEHHARLIGEEIKPRLAALEAAVNTEVTR